MPVADTEFRDARSNRRRQRSRKPLRKARKVLTMSDDAGKAVRDAQREHWERMLESRPEMFGQEPSEPARLSAAEFERAGVRRVLELGGGQGRDTLFFAAKGFEVHVLDYSKPGVDAIVEKANRAGLAERVSASRHDVRLPLRFADGEFDA